MQSKHIDQIRRDLVHWLVTRARNSNELLVKWANASENLPDELDKANLHYEMDFALSRLLREGLNKNNMLRALHKIDEGIYGICEACEEELCIERLKAIPDARYCIACQVESQKVKERVEG